MRKTLRMAALAVPLAGALLLPAGAASAAPPDRTWLDTTSVNGGDNGIGNCGRNASGGRKSEGSADPFVGHAGNGYGGFKAGDRCVWSPNDELEQIGPSGVIVVV